MSWEPLLYVMLLIRKREEIIINFRTVDSFKAKLKTMIHLLPCSTKINDNEIKILKTLIFVVIKFATSRQSRSEC